MSEILFSITILFSMNPVLYEMLEVEADRRDCTIEHILEEYVEERLNGKHSVEDLRLYEGNQRSYNGLSGIECNS